MKTYIMAFSPKHQKKAHKSPKGVFLVLKVPGDENRSFTRVSNNDFMFISNIFKFLESFRKFNGHIKVMWKTVSFLAISGHFGGFFTLLSPWGHNRSFFSKI